MPELKRPELKMTPTDQHLPQKLPKPFKIYYACPDTPLASAGIRRLYRHVALLSDAGFDAAVLHMQSGFNRSDMPRVPVEYMDRITPGTESTVVIPEGLTRIMASLRNSPCRRFAIALNWDYIFKNLPDGMDWRSYGIERALTVSPAIGRMISWSMDLPVHLIDSGIDTRRYWHDPDIKRPQVSFIHRKGVNVDQIKRMLSAHNNDFISKIKWVGLNGLSEDEYAAEIRKSGIFLNASLAEGYPTSCLEAMAAGAMVIGYDAVGGRDILCGQGPAQNCILAPNGDYISLAYALAPVLTDLIEGRMNRWAHVITNGKKTASGVTLEKEKDALISFWRKVCTPS